MVIINGLNKTTVVNDSIFHSVYETDGFKILFTENKNIQNIQTLKEYYETINRMNDSFEFICVDVEVGFEIEINF